MVLRDFELNYLEKWLPEASVKYKDGSPAVNLGLIITVFFKDGHTPDVRRRMVECVDRFYMEFKPYLKKHYRVKGGPQLLRKTTQGKNKQYLTLHLKKFSTGH